MNTNEYFCRRLAQEALKPPPLDATPLVNLQAELVRLFHNEPQPFTEEGLVALLLDNPRAQAELAQLSEYTPSKWLLERELEARGFWPPQPGAESLQSADSKDEEPGDPCATLPGLDPDAYAVARQEGAATGLCFSGGGIRSATFNLGVLQALASMRLLNRFTYLSSVSGGGYIHQFLAAWIHHRSHSNAAVPISLDAAAAAPIKVPKPRTHLEEVEELLEPLPEPQWPQEDAGGKPPYRTLASSPVRWLARYSNYLAPRKGAVGLDSWTIFAVWLRNTLLNLVVVLSAFVVLLLVPHIPITQQVIAWSDSIPPNGKHDVYVAVGMLMALLIPGWFFRKWVRYADCPREANPALWAPKLWQIDIYKLALVLYLAACIAAPAVYRASLPREFSYFHATHESVNPAFASTPQPVELHYKASFNRQTAERLLDSLNVEAEIKNASARSRLHDHWSEKPAWFLYHPPGHPLKLTEITSWPVWRSPFPFTRVAFVLGNAVAMMMLGFAARDESECPDPDAETAEGAQPAQPKAAPGTTAKPRAATSSRPGVNGWGFLGLTLLGLAFSWMLLFGVRMLFFMAAFAVPPELISSLGVVMLPPLLFAIPFIVMELGVGLLGNALSDEKREWLARLRAASFLSGAAWVVVTGFSLLGPWVYDGISQTASARWTVWAGWLATTLGGVLAGRSPRTSGAGEAEESSPRTSLLLQVVTAVAPPVFIAGLLLLIAKLTSWSIGVDAAPYIQPASLPQVLLAIGVFALLGLLFGWRVNINDFSMHAFYRDRLARCYAGASDPKRSPNTFTGFAPKDRKLPITALLGRDWRSAPGAEAPDATAYTGPFPIICTAVNLTTGADLAYQERKAASFVFTPLFSGFDVGRTAGRNKNVQFNGFVPTSEYVYTDVGGISLATAVAISGAAASPNMGYHSSPAMAFLMTVFNVRLGWWLRNPRRRPQPLGWMNKLLRALGYVPQGAGPRKPSDTTVAVQGEGATHRPEDLPLSVPEFGLLRLLDELFGRANDSSEYVYLTDGGHFDNVGLYELIRRRCRLIVVCDAEADGQLHFEGLAMSIRKARLDFGVEIILNGVDPALTEAEKANEERSAAGAAGRTSGPAPEKDGDDANAKQAGGAAPSPVAEVLSALPMSLNLKTETSETGEIGMSGELGPARLTDEQTHGIESFKPYPENKTHAVFGTIIYPEAPNCPAHILYIKSSLNGDEPVDVLNFRRNHKSFPHDTTLNQFFTESQFESYRRLGQHIVEQDATVQKWLGHFLQAKNRRSVHSRP